MSPGPRILVVGPAWVGDMVMCQSLFMVLRERHPDSDLDVLAPDWTRPLLERMPQVDEALALPVGHGELRPLAQWRLAREVRRRAYDWAVVTRRSLKAALIPWLAGIPRRTGILGEHRWRLINDVRDVSADTHPSTVERLAVLGMEAGARPGMDGVPWPRLRTDEARAARLEQELGLEGEGPVVGMAPGAAFGPAKRWPLERWGELAGELDARGCRVWIFGSAGEAAEGESIARAAGGDVRSLCGRTGLEDVVDLMARCMAVVSNDSGLMHVAAAAGTRVVAIFGSSSPVNTPPLSPEAEVIWLGLECSPCFQRECPLGHLRCLREIPVSRVLDAVGATGGPVDPERRTAGGDERPGGEARGLV